MEEPPQQPATNGPTEPRRNKSVRVAFGPDLETTIPARERSPAPLSSHHRSFTTVEHKPPSLAPPSVRPTSSAGENAVIGPSSPPRRPSPRRSESSRPAMLKRAKSDYGPSRVTFDQPVIGDDEEDFAMRHGWQEEYTSSEYLKILHSVRMRRSLGLASRVRANWYLSEFLHVFHGETSRDQRYPQRSRRQLA
jgi:regulator-associated protein of mTOR